MLIRFKLWNFRLLDSCIIRNCRIQKTIARARLQLCIVMYLCTINQLLYASSKNLIMILGCLPEDYTNCYCTSYYNNYCSYNCINNYYIIAIHLVSSYYYKLTITLLWSSPWCCLLKLFAFFHWLLFLHYWLLSDSIFILLDFKNTPIVVTLLYQALHSGGLHLEIDFCRLLLMVLLQTEANSYGRLAS